MTGTPNADSPTTGSGIDINSAAVTCLADVLSWFEDHGIRITSLGEEGDQWMVAGHHDEPAIWTAWESFTGNTKGDRGVHDLEQGWAKFSDHSEGCERDACDCLEETCGPCTSGEHDGCAGECTCDEFDHALLTDGCGCECACDEFAWWVSSAKDGQGDAVTWIRYSYTKARAASERHLAGVHQ